MKVLSLSGAGVATLGLMLASVVPDAGGANPRRAVAIPARRAVPEAARQPLMRPSSQGATPVPCPSDYATYSFVGIDVSGSHDFAFGDSSGVASGYGNEACSADDGILSGESNLIGTVSTRGDTDWSSIAGGEFNDITSELAFIGAGMTNAATGNASFVGAGENNLAGAQGTVVGGGFDNRATGSAAFVGSGSQDSASGAGAVVGGGTENAAGADEAFIGAGEMNTANGLGAFVGAGSDGVASGQYSFDGAGTENLVSGKGSFIGAGDYTYSMKSNPTFPANQVSGTDSFLGAGDQNTIAANDAFVGSGNLNAIAKSGTYGAIDGGNGNALSGAYAWIGSGSANNAAGAYAVIPGGEGNEALGYASFAGGFHAGAMNDGSFVWSDEKPGSAVVSDGAADQFVVRASGGTYVYSSETLASGVMLAPGSGTWSSVSDRNAKTAVAPLDDASILAKVGSLPVGSWQYKTESGVRHIGPMAQDFYAAFGVGEDDRHITSIDEDGVALAAIKALHRENESLRARLAALEARIDALSRARVR